MIRKGRKEIEVHLQPETIAALDRFRKRRGWSRREALRRILTHEIRSGSVAKMLKEARKP